MRFQAYSAFIQAPARPGSICRRQPHYASGVT